MHLDNTLIHLVMNLPIAGRIVTEHRTKSVKFPPFRETNGLTLMWVEAFLCNFLSMKNLEIHILCSVVDLCEQFNGDST